MKSRKLNLRTDRVTEDKFIEGVLYRCVGSNFANYFDEWVNCLSYKENGIRYGIRNGQVWDSNGDFFGKDYVFQRELKVKDIKVLHAYTGKPFSKTFD